MKTFRFLEFKVYKDAKEYFKSILLISERIKNYSFRDQIRRASLSIMLNIAEGSAKKSDIEFARFLEISIGSLNEVVACIDIMKELKKIDAIEHNNIMIKSEELAKQLGGFIKKLKVNS
jgi:four helix bundle protein